MTGPTFGAHPGDAVAGLLIGSSTTMGHLRAVIARAAPLDLPVLIQGPTGAGKELVATALHRLSGRSCELFRSLRIMS